MARGIPTLFEIARVVRRARVRLGMSQVVFAKHVGVSDDVIYGLEGENPPYASVARLTPLAKLLGVEPSWLHPSGRMPAGGRDYKKLAKADARRAKRAAEDYPEGVVRPVTRGDCLTVEGRLHLRVLMDALDPAAPSGEAVMEEDGKPDGVNCQRPCPWVTCKHHLYVRVSRSGSSMEINFPDVEPHEMAELAPWELAKMHPEDRAALPRGRTYQTCSLDVAEAMAGAAEPLTLEETGELLGVSREWVRRLEARSFAKLQGKLESLHHVLFDEDE